MRLRGRSLSRALASGGLLLALTSLTHAQPELPTTLDPVGVFTYIQGAVLSQRYGFPTWYPANLWDTVYPGDRLQTTEQGRCEVTLATGNFIRIDTNTNIHVGEIKRADPGEVKVSLTNGKVWAYLKGATERLKKVEVPEAIKRLSGKIGERLRALPLRLEAPRIWTRVKGTTYQMEVAPDSATHIAVFEGEVEVRRLGEPERKRLGPGEVEGPREVSLEEWVEIVKAQQELYIRPDGTFEKPQPMDLQAAAKSEWVSWNQERDRQLTER